MIKVEVLGLPLFARDIPAAVALVVQGCLEAEGASPRCISATGAHGLVFAHANPDFHALLRRFYLNLPDGMPAVWVGRWKGARAMQRCYGPDFFAAVMEATAALPVRHFFCGGKEGVADRLREAVAEKFGNRNVVGTHCPPFRPLTDDEFAALGAEIDATGAHVVWIGISTPKQERFAAALARHTRARFIATVGAAFDFHIGAVPQAPAWVQRAGMEWFFRVLMEPRRLWRRYAGIVPAFIYLNLKERIFHPDRWRVNRSSS
ncbi:WecB/TagA/CpsF family glycosyltransferase [Rhodocaloribacter litoris]|uniref:WecB/TagA/CpsF family glycosyltransferase n=1 Tax=Rhodocaloribacter litoris TaxID=2558931 RepID=UPI00141F1813|nr:WecB/TagA/CpsF family glycosyltransferase [Rhodocaloribacter litoris]QXD14348.1 WecB/TagA/CpsF family glycosyltransferase [Rhodocaloribacter litoris]